ncbi:GyrI-like domain-containing protein [Microbacterium mangrovi]|uniref:GyrI-like domain-containing protein n=1 Tax=Microbacterium mangrovi TaxID=1348253 RepID=UPI0012E04E4B|nr:GyrI-like domain-containing protein [Microbacterium mangrovi]
MSEIDVTEKPLPAVRLAARRTVVVEQREIPDFVGPAFAAVAEAVGGPAGALATPIAQYDMGEAGTEITVGYAYDGPELPGVEIVELPAADRAVCGIHLGSMERIAQSWQALQSAIAARGMVPAGPCRELYVRAESDDQSDWVTELQQPVA